jgi:hypothetical protein
MDAFTNAELAATSFLGAGLIAAGAGASLAFGKPDVAGEK